MLYRHTDNWLPQIIAACAMIGALARASPQSVAAEPLSTAKTNDRQVVDFNRDVRPILAAHCFQCHGLDEKTRKANLRLDTRDGLLAVRDELLARVTARDPNERMPPPSSGKELTPAQTATLRQWVQQGGAWSDHWAFVAPKRQPLPPVSDTAWPRHPVDRFILARLEAEGLKPSAEADRATLLRRVTLDLTGLPPAPHEIEGYLADASPDAYEKLVDRLLASPRYGEHRARDWLDAARFADTHGYFTDHERFMWRWRDWVIDAFNANMPFDQFTVEQLAGDLLPNATLPQRIATGFNRNHMVTEETGVIPEEYRTEYVADRLRTTGAVWLGLTVGCAQCHDHKYDPLTQREFYRLFAYFNSVPEQGISGGKKNADPVLDLAGEADKARLADSQQRLATLEKQLKNLSGKSKDAERAALEVEIAKLQAEQRRFLVQSTTMVMRDMDQARDTFVLVRGQYDQRGERVQPGVPTFLPALPTGAPPNRLGLARWLVDPRHPLTARVAVNRLWRQLFGQGLIPAAEDFGVRGEPPSHPELLDWLAVDFVGSGWDVKRLERQLLLSATYRQSSRVTPALLRADPKNRLFARGSRHRLDAETIRDSALVAAGLFVEQVGGPSVKPYQPPDLWRHIIYDKKNTQSYDQGTGPDLYRRSMYSYWKRQIPPPTLQLFDAPSRETCVLERQRTNTPLQALALLNDVQFVEAGRVLGQRLAKQPGSNRDRVALGLRWVTARQPATREVDEIVHLVAAERQEFGASPDRARALLRVGESGRDKDLDAAELAAWTVVGNLLLNLDEFLNRE